jgi:hypothetical protein
MTMEIAGVKAVRDPPVGLVEHADAFRIVQSPNTAQSLSFNRAGRRGRERQYRAA